jgi:hypothetical protein
MQAYLKKHGGSFGAHSIKISWKRSAELVTIEFQVQKRTGPGWQTDPVFTQDWSKNWGLWNKDVVEAFLQLREHDQDTRAPYLEIQVSPLNQPFALIITEPRKTFFAPAKLDFHTSVEMSDKFWTGKLEVRLPEELRGTHLYGGFFACLATEQREYYALEPNPEMNPDFHRPELFLPLDQA